MDKSMPTNSIKGALLYTNNPPFHYVSNFMARDKEQSRRLHEPTSIMSHTDPITGNDVMGLVHPFAVDGIVTVYFESEQTRQTYMEMPFNHPVTKLAGEPSPEDDRGG